MNQLVRTGIIVGYPNRGEGHREPAVESPPVSNSSLLPRAQKIPLGESWASYRRYFWLSENELVFLRHPPGHKKGDYVICRLDLRTRREVTLHPLTHRFNQYRGLRWEESVSPDGQWLLWTDVEDKRQTVTVASLTGKQPFSWVPDDVYDPICWMPDSRAILSTELSQTYGHRATLRHVYASHTPKPFRFNPAPEVPLTNISTVHLVSSDRMLIVPWCDPDKETRQATLFETSLQRTPPTSQRFPISFPPGAFIQELCFSPDGTRIAWALILRQKGHTPVESVWVSESNGSNLRQIGQITLPANQTPDISFLSWTPQGRHLSFVARDTLWRVATV